MSASRISKLRSGLFYVLPAIALLSITTAAATRPVESNSKVAIEAASAWVAANRATLPTQLDSMAALPVLYRRLVMQELTLAQRKAIWREHFSSFVLPENARSRVQTRIAAGLSKPMTNDQEAFVFAEIDSLEETFRSDLTVEERAQRASALCVRAHKVLDPQDARLLTVYLGGVDSTYGWATSDRQAPLRIRTAGIAWSVAAALRSTANRVGLVPPSRAPRCFCAQGQWGCDGCGGGTLCTQAWPACETCAICGWCCGCLGMQQCDGAKCAS